MLAYTRYPDETARVEMMTESEFNNRVDDLLQRIEEQLDEIGVDFDYVTAGGILTLSFETGSKLIINRQSPVTQVWVATPDGGHHFDFDRSSGSWLNDKNGEELFSALSGYCTALSGEEIRLTAN